ncbi:MAG: hypothetical protein I8H76_12600 [Burkholderiales bacterium]|nr:hypothetical protein [Burkholderiales bacterium]MBH2015061.1 hypothetical protein [Burkholderiales bacterium]
MFFRLIQRTRGWPLLLLALLGACAPALNWREVRPPHADGLVGSFPCKPDTRERRLSLPGVERPVTMHLWSCEADGATWALGFLRLDDALAVAPALRALAASTRDNLKAAGGQPAQAEDLGGVDVPRMTPQADARGWRFSGQRPDGGGTPGDAQVPVSVTAWHFSHGLTVFQASVWRTGAPAAGQSGQEAADAFMRGFHFPG